MLVLASEVKAEIAQSPLFLPQHPPPNIMFILDNSGSMKYNTVTGQDADSEYTSAKNNVKNYGAEGCGRLDYCSPYAQKNQAAFYSSRWNRIYYDPSIRYKPGLDAAGKLMPNASTIDTRANAYNPKSAIIHPRAICKVKANKKFTLPLYDPSTYETINNCKRNGDTEIAQYAFYYTLAKSQTPNGSKAQDLLYERWDILPSNRSYPADVNRTDCGIGLIGCSYEQELQNFANWFSYYRSRELLTKTVLGIAFSELNGNARVGFSTINGTDENFIPVAPFVSAQRQKWYDQLYGTAMIGATPLIAALDNVGQYYSGHEVHDFPKGIPDPIKLQCQANYAILATDGQWNVTRSTIANWDKNVMALPEDIAFDPVSGTPLTAFDPWPAPYHEGPKKSKSSLADTAMKYWATDVGSRLGKSTAGLISPNEYDPATWQHMVTHTIALGADGELKYQSDYRTATTGDFPEIKSGKKNWPFPVKNSQSAADDVWHAAVNGHGTYFSALNPQDLKSGFLAMLKEIRQQNAAGSSIAYSGNSLSGNALTYLPSFETEKWTGHLKAYSLKDGKPDLFKWDAADLIPDSKSRNIVTWSAEGGQKFLQPSLSAAQMVYLKSSEIVDYLRGNDEKENKNGGPYRNRANKLGNIVNSSPLFVSRTNFGYAMPSDDKHGGASYAAFLQKKSSPQRPAMLYVGANDGMLHAFNATSGVETFAFVPYSVYPHLYALSQPEYQHHYFVDGPLTEADAYINFQWKNILLGSTGAGSKAVFAIDITDPATMGTANILWERSAENDTNDFADMGHVLGTASVARLTNGQWAAIYGNGYDSIGGKALLYIVDLASGNLIRALNIEVGSVDKPNGLSAPGLLFNNKRELIAAYAGDLQGNLWKFDLQSATVTDWHSKKLFTATTKSAKVAPIVQQPLLAPHPTGGYMVIFGTGKYLEFRDKADLDIHALYGVWDKPGETQPKQRKHLQPQTLTPLYKDNVIIGRTLTNNTVDWTTQNGWYIDMLNNGERFVGRLRIIEITVLLSTTLAPAANACSGDGTSFTMATDFLIGGVAKNFVFIGADGKPITDSNGNNASSIETGGTSSEGVSIPGIATDCLTINQLDGTTKCIPYKASSETMRRWRQLSVPAVIRRRD
ncbi:pilus assembly protein [Glaciimonas immobilis]|uniref:Type IV pilus assembly protein PilY1 n=1 Tax=Glaciimonas immobilis TaxID=728004 RepID=A0A840RUL9_9BURK|nr:PilC/PilY family type IV pilus protein [Glaciimonas immobilis]KAF3997696.1 hypothetical protein HAV38_13635 [Glaciimonas immobilis]MBB5200586.1 type IV pilus assembly protein PilY1 [Glaciimonas immobilis]